MSARAQEHINRMKEGLYYFNYVDYIVFGAMLLVSALMGLYFGCRSRYFKRYKAMTLQDYLTGSGTMRPFPVAMSLVASYISAVTLLGTPAEIYNFGSQYWYVVIAISFSGVVVAFVYLPVFVRLQVCSSYQYLEMRFNKTVRIVASIYFVLDEIMFLPVLMYVPSLAFNQVSGINIHLIGTVVSIICVFYTVLGGIKAVVYTDTLQILVMFLAIIVVLILGIIAVDGTGLVFQRSIEGDRLQAPNFSSSLYERYTFWSIMIGGCCYWTSFNSVNQTMVQRYLSLPNERLSKISVGIFTFGVVIIVSVCCFTGLLIYSTYHDCDPLTSGRIKSPDQLLPLFVMETAGHLQGVPGLFIAGVFGAALSSLSVVLNSTSLVVLQDFIRGWFRFQMTEKTAQLVCKMVVLVLGVMAVGFLYIVEHLGGILATASSLSAIAAGTSFGMFSLGMLVPWSNDKGCIAGAVTGSIVAGVVSFGSRYVNAVGLVVERQLPISVRNCDENYGIFVNSSVIEYPDQTEIFPLFRLSYLWITPVGTVTVMVVGVLVSWATGFTDVKTLDPELISPVAQWMLPEEAKRFTGTAVKGRDANLNSEQGATVLNDLGHQGPRPQDRLIN